MKNVDKRISQLEAIATAKEWKGRIVGIQQDDCFDVTTTDQQGNRDKFTLSIQEFQRLTENSEHRVLIIQ